MSTKSPSQDALPKGELQSFVCGIPRTGEGITTDKQEAGYTYVQSVYRGVTMPTLDEQAEEDVKHQRLTAYNSLADFKRDLESNRG